MEFALTSCEVLAAVLHDADIRLVDVGGRGSAIAPLMRLVPFSQYYVSEPDAAEAERLKHDLPLEAPWRGVTVIGEAIASRRGHADLYLTHRPGMSSLLEPDPAVAARFYLGETFKVARVAQVATLPLDDAAATYGFEDACFLKLDTQGTELDILASGDRLVDRSLLGVYTESLFHPFYKGQSLFADVDRHLRERGFSLFSLSRTLLRRSGFRTDIFSKRVISWAHCLYLREPASLPDDNPETRRRLPRLLGLSLAFEYYDLAFEIVAAFRRLELLAPGDLDRLTAEVELLAEKETRRVVRRAAKRGLADAVLGANFRDKNQLE